MINPTLFIAVVCALVLTSVGGATAKTSGPESSFDPASGLLIVKANGAIILNAMVTVRNKSCRLVKGESAVHSAEVIATPAVSVHLGYPHGPAEAGGVPEGTMARSLIVTLTPSAQGQTLALDGSVNASSDSLACAPNEAPLQLRGAVGAPFNALNTGVFDRPGDWALDFAGCANKEVRRGNTSGGKAGYTVSATGPKLIIKLDSEFLRVHRGYFYWNPAKKVWKDPVVGWCSWAAYGGGVREEDVIAASDFITANLSNYGFKIVQIDDGFQRFSQGDPKLLKPGEPLAELWAIPNDKFPHGMQWLAQEISKRGLQPGIWISASIPPGMPDGWYVKDASGKAFRGPWVNWAIDGYIPQAVDTAFRDTIKATKAQGWDYFKIDTIRHVIYDSYRKVPEFWAQKNENPELAFRKIFQGISDEIGPSIYMLSCWGTIPEMAGIADGSRIGEDVGGSWDSLWKVQKYISQFNYLNNIVWRNDPDYMCLSVSPAWGRTWASLVSLTGSQMMISDKPSDYSEEKLDILRRVSPPVFVRPSVLRSLDPEPEFCQLDVSANGESWSVVQRSAWKEGGLAGRDVPFAELGLDAATAYLVWDFWNEKLVGCFKGSFPAAALDRGDCRVYGIRAALDRPQVLSTNRHISQGAYELSGVKWRGGKLSGSMLLPPIRPFSLYVYAPEGYSLRSEQVGWERVQEGVYRTELHSSAGGKVDWSVTFDRTRP